MSNLTPSSEYTPFHQFSFPRRYTSNSDSSSIESKGDLEYGDGANCHHRWASESILFDEQPSWFEDLLKEPDTPLQRVHLRRSASDSFTYLEQAAETITATEEPNYGLVEFGASLGSHLVNYEDEVSTLETKATSLVEKNNQEGAFFFQQSEEVSPFDVELSRDESSAQNLEGSANNDIGAQSNPVVSKEPKRKQSQSATPPLVSHAHSLRDSITASSPSSLGPPSGRSHSSWRTRLATCRGSSTCCAPPTPLLPVRLPVCRFWNNAHWARVRKLQYISHLEKTVDMLKMQGSGISSELEFLEQQNMILTMENRALRQRLESISQEQLIKQWEQGMLEREITRLQSLFHLQKQQQMQMQQKQQQKQRRNKSRDFDQQANSSFMKNKDGRSSNGSINTSAHT